MTKIKKYNKGDIVIIDSNYSSIKVVIITSQLKNTHDVFWHFYTVIDPISNVPMTIPFTDIIRKIGTVTKKG